jgi:hypothetical protein
MQSWKDLSGRRKLAIGAIVIAVLAGGGAYAADRFGEEPAKKPARAQDEPRKYTKPVGKRLELGEVAKISDNYSVAVTEVVVYEGEKVQILAATIRAEYIGNNEGEPWADLAAEYVEANGWSSGESSCPRGIDDETDEPLAVGDVTTHVACMVLRSTNVKGGRVYVEEALAKSKRVAWSTDDAVTKELPSPPPDSVAGAGGAPPRTSWQAPSGGRNDVDDEELEEFEEWKDGIREYKEWADKADKNVDKYSSNKKKIAEWREWKEEFDEDYEEWEEVYGD